MSRTLATTLVAALLAGCSKPERPPTPTVTTTHVTDTSTISCAIICKSAMMQCLDSLQVPADLVDECAAACRNARPETVDACLKRDGFCSGLLPCIHGEGK